MDTTTDVDALALPEGFSVADEEHLANIAANLQLIADLGYGDAALAVRLPDGSLKVAADSRPVTAVAAVAASRRGRVLARDEEPEAYRALEIAEPVIGDRRRTTRGISYVTSAYPLGTREHPLGVMMRDLTQQVYEAPGTMERAFMAMAEDLITMLRGGPLRSIADDRPFATTRTAGDGIMRISRSGEVEYASPNVVNIMKLAGVDTPLLGMPASHLPGGAVAIVPVLRSKGALATVAEVTERVLRYRTIDLPSGAVVLVQDVTEARRQEQELKVKEATIREVHHRVKNNLQTIASLLRIQARRSTTAEATRALEEAVERVSSMAVVHEMLAASTEENVDFAAAARTVVDMVAQGLTGGESRVTVSVEGDAGRLAATTATSLALVLAELVHNAIEHGLREATEGSVAVTMRRLPDQVHMTVRDDGAGLPDGFEAASSANLGLAIVKTIVEDDLRGTLDFGGARGTTVTIRVPVHDDKREEDD